MRLFVFFLLACLYQQLLAQPAIPSTRLLGPDRVLVGTDTFPLNKVPEAYREQVNRVRNQQADIFLQKAAAAIRSSQDTAGLLWLNRAISVSLQPADLFMLRAWLGLRNQVWSAAWQDAGKVLQQQPANSKAMLVQALALQGAGKTAEAQTGFEKMLKEAPGHPLASVQLARLYLQAGGPGKAKAVVTRGLQANPRNEDLTNLFAEIIQNEDSGEFKLSDFPGGSVPAATMLNLAASGKLPGANNWLDSLARQQPPTDHGARALHLKGRRLFALGDFSKAAAHMSLAASQLPDSHLLLNDLAAALAMQGQYAKAARYQAMAVELQPQSALYRYQRGLLHEALQQKEQACTDYAAAWELGSEAAGRALQKTCKEGKQK